MSSAQGLGAAPGDGATCWAPATRETDPGWKFGAPETEAGAFRGGRWGGGRAHEYLPWARPAAVGYGTKPGRLIRWSRPWRPLVCALVPRTRPAGLRLEPGVVMVQGRSPDSSAGETQALVSPVEHRLQGSYNTCQGIDQGRSPARPTDETARLGGTARQTVGLARGHPSGVRWNRAPTVNTTSTGRGTP